MGEVIAVFRVMPDSPDNFSEVRAQIEKFRPAKIEEEPVAFGLKAIIASFIIPDEGGKMDELENRLNGLKGAQAVETLRVSRSL